MKVDYCDLCGQPIKEEQSWFFYMSPPQENRTTDMDYNEYASYLRSIQKETKEVCSTCKHIFDKMFELRLHRLSELTEEINCIFNLTPKPNPRERKNGKEKK